MMLNELQEGLQLIFDKELSDQQHEEKDTFYFEQNDPTNRLIYPNGEMILELFSTLADDNKLKCFLIDTLKKQIYEAPETQEPSSSNILFYRGISPLCFYSLIELGYVNDALLSVQKRCFSRTSYAINELIMIFLEKNIFDSDQLREISKLLNTFGEAREKILKARLALFTRKFRKVNVEINQDKAAVSKKIKDLGLNGNYIGLLNSIDDFIKTDSIYMNAGAISDLRSFMADLLKDIANLIANKIDEEIPKNPGCQETGNIRKYLKNKLELSEWDENFIDSFVVMLHKEGGHTFWSEKEYFRLCKNIAIEIALLMLTKYERKYGR